MTLPTELKPTQRERIIDLVKAAGHSVDDWSTGKGGAAKASTNPKYAFEWAFSQPGRPIVINLWLDRMVEVDGQIRQTLNLKLDSLTDSKPIRKSRRNKMAQLIATAFKDQLPVRVIVLDGIRRGSTPSKEDRSKVTARCMDPMPWHVASVDNNSGEIILERGIVREAYVDQFGLESEDPDVGPERRPIAGTAFARDRSIRMSVLKRARGQCEYCGQLGFRTAKGAIYLETHHVIPLSEGGVDQARNVVALCPNDHKLAHYSESSVAIRSELLALVGRRRLA